MLTGVIIVEMKWFNSSRQNQSEQLRSFKSELNDRIVKGEQKLQLRYI